MIPYFQLTTIRIGPVSIHAWGTLVSLGILSAIILTVKVGREKGLDTNKIWDASFGMVLAAFLGARLMHVLGYEWPYYAAHLSEIYKFWHGGLSATGGVLGTLAYFAFFVRRHKLDFWLYADAFAYAFPLGYCIGRLGCFLVHDHPGTLSHFILAVKYPGGARHDLGLYLSISAGLMFLVMAALKRWEPVADGKRGWPKGFYAAAFFVWYGLSRFFLDFLRAYDLPISDTRYYGLTPAQYFGIVLFTAGVYNFYKIFYVRKGLKT